MILIKLWAVYYVSHSILATVVVSALIGVRQGAPTSCFLFTVFVNVLVRKIKNKYPNDGFLSWVSVLMLMDDTVILSTSRDKCIEKVKIMLELGNEYGMVINENKTKFMAINATNSEKYDLDVTKDDLSISVKHCDDYVYLGSIFTADGNVRSAIKLRATRMKKNIC